MPGAPGEIACADRLTNGSSVSDAIALSAVPKVQLVGSSKKPELTAQCARVTGGGRIESAFAEIATELISAQKQKTQPAKRIDSLLNAVENAAAAKCTEVGAYVNEPHAYCMPTR